MLNCILFLTLFLFTIFIFRKLYRNKDSIAFFHPYCDGGGGGERVLFEAIQTLKHKSAYRNKRIVVYSRVPNNDKNEILSNIQLRFNIFIDENDIEFIQLKTIPWMNPKNFPRFTLILQSLGELFVAFEAIIQFLPEIFIDTTGCPLSLPLFKIVGGCKTACYVHYPTITTQMIKRVETGVEMYNNSSFIANNKNLISAKIIYYKLFAQIYKIVGRTSDVVMVNGSWTEEHIKNLWNCSPFKVFPPVDLELVDKDERRTDGTAMILSVGQIRPEKNHKLQIDVLKLALGSKLDVRLCIAGGCRNNEDIQRVEELKKYAKSLDVDKYIDWELNIPIERLRELNSKALIGIHTMTEEHFGIAVVESMAAGVIMIAHNSGGPKLDIVKDNETGFLAISVEEYVNKIAIICNMEDEELTEMREMAKKSMEKFSVKSFEKSWLSAIGKL